MKRHLASLVVATTAAALVAAGCGGSQGGANDGTPASQWANGFCSALTSWTSSMTSLADALDSSSLSTDSLQSATDAAKSATEKLARDWRAIGKPDTESGVEATNSLDRLSANLQADLVEIEQVVGDLTGVSELVSALPVIGRKLSTMGKRVQSMLQELEQLDTNGQLEDALRQASACDDLTK